MSIPRILVASATVASAAINPYVSAELGLSIPSLKGGAYQNDDLDDLPDGFEIDWSGEGEGQFSWSIGAGVLIPMSESIRLDAWGGYSSVPYKATHTMSLSGNDSYSSGGTTTYYTFEGEEIIEIDVTTSLFEFGGGMRWSATPALGVGCGFQYSMVSTSEFEGELTTHSVFETTGSTSETEESMDERDIKGDLEDIEKVVGDTTETPNAIGFKTKPQDFYSLRLSADYAIMPSLSVTAGYVYPLADHLEGKTLNGTLQRAFVGVRWQFGDL